MRYLREDVERRSHRRHQVWLPAQVDELKEGVAVTHDASPSGVKMVAASTLEVGATVSITFWIPPGGEQERHLTGRVVRVERNQADPLGMWPHRIAVEFDELDEELEPILRELALKLQPDK
jgi:hypothetical protein